MQISRRLKPSFVCPSKARMDFCLACISLPLRCCGANWLWRNRTVTHPPSSSISGSGKPADVANSAILTVPRPQRTPAGGGHRNPAGLHSHFEPPTTTTLDYATSDENAQAGSDHTAASGTLTFRPAHAGIDPWADYADERRPGFPRTLS